MAEDSDKKTVLNGKSKCREKSQQLIYCSVSFREFGQTYYYRTEDDELAVGDNVLVPAGVKNEEKIGVIEIIEYFDPERVPFPLEKTKLIISSNLAKATKAEKNDEHVIYSQIINGISVHVRAEIKDGCLLISGQDLGVPFDFFDGEYEYFYSFDHSNTLVFAEILTRQTEDRDKFLDALTKKIKGPAWYEEFTCFCEKNDLKYSAFSC